MNSYQLLPAYASTGRHAAAHHATAIRHPGVQYRETFCCGDRLHQGLLALCIAAAVLIVAGPLAHGQNSAVNRGGGPLVTGPAIQPSNPGTLPPNVNRGGGPLITSPAIQPSNPGTLLPNNGAMIPGSVVSPGGAVTPNGEAGPGGGVVPGGVGISGNVVAPSGAVTPGGMVGPGSVVAPSGAVTPGGIVGPASVISPQTPLPPGTSRMLQPTVQSQGATMNGLQILQANPYYTSTNNFYQPGTNGFATPGTNNFYIPGSNGFGAFTNR